MMIIMLIMLMTTVIVTKRKITERKINKPQEKQVSHNTVVHYLLTDTHPVPKHSQPFLDNFSQFIY